LKASRYEEAISLMTRARDLEPGPRWTVELARAIAASGQLLRARQLLSKAIEKARPEQRYYLEAARDELEARIPTLRIQVSGPAPGVASVEIDGEKKEGSVHQLDPGPHSVRVSAPGFLTAEEQTTLLEASPHELLVTLRLDSTPDPVPSVPVTSSSSAWRRPVAVGSFVVAGAGVVTGALLWMKRNGKNREANDLFDQCDPRVCSKEERQRIANLDDEAKNAAIIAGVSLGVAAIAAGTGAFLLWDESADTADQRALVVEPGLGSLLLRGTF